MKVISEVKYFVFYNSNIFNFCYQQNSYTLSMFLTDLFVIPDFGFFNFLCRVTESFFLSKKINRINYIDKSYTITPTNHETLLQTNHILSRAFEYYFMKTRSSRPAVFCKYYVLKNFAKCTGKRDADRCFPVNFAKFLRKLFFIENLTWLLLEIEYDICMISYITSKSQYSKKAVNYVLRSHFSKDATPT